MCFPCFQILGRGRNLTLIFSRSIWELHLSNVPSPGLQTSALMISTLETSLQFPKFVGGGVVLRLEKWVSGAYAGHTAVCLRESEGKLWVDESGHDNEQAEDVIAVLPRDGWWEFELNKDDSNPHIALLPLHPDMRAKFNETAAWKYAQSMNGKPYGYHNVLFSWIDTIDANYPPPLDAHVVASIMTVWNQMQPAYAANMWNEALNKRLGTEGLDLPDLIVETKMRGSYFAELLTIPEQDDWVYSNRKSTSCVALFLKYTKQQDSLIQFLAPFK